MNNCPNCRVGNTKQSGSHLFCDNCGFVRFVMTDEYVDSCANLVATLVSNTRFNDIDAMRSNVSGAIVWHLPQLAAYVETILNGKEEFIMNFTDAVKASAINLIIGDETTNPVEHTKDLVCKCGCKAFDILTIGALSCRECNAKYMFDLKEGIYTPLFTCNECGSTDYEDLGAGIIACEGCGKAYQQHGNKVEEL